MNHTPETLLNGPPTRSQRVTRQARSVVGSVARTPRKAPITTFVHEMRPAVGQFVHSFNRCPFGIRLILLSTRAYSIFELSPATLHANYPLPDDSGTNFRRAPCRQHRRTSIDVKSTQIIAGLAIAGGLAAGAVGFGTGMANAAPGMTPAPTQIRLLPPLGPPNCGPQGCPGAPGGHGPDGHGPDGRGPGGPGPDDRGRGGPGPDGRGPGNWGPPPPPNWGGPPDPGGWNGGWEPNGGLCLGPFCV
jgi:hypothetical protein